MVRRVRPERALDARRPLSRLRLRRRGRSRHGVPAQAPGPRAAATRWTGPPPLLLGVTVVALVVAPFLHGRSEVGVRLTSATRSTMTSPRTIEPRVIAPQQVLPRIQGGRAGRGVAPAPVRLKPLRVGVASFNMFHQLSSAEARHDALKVTGRSRVDIVGWQEAEAFGHVLHRIPGWRTETFRNGRHPSELAVSWRASEWRLVRSHARVAARGVAGDEGLYPMGNRQIASVTLAHRGTGRELTVLDVHLPQAIEDLDRLGRWRPTLNAGRARGELRRIAASWRHAPGRWVVSTGDYNFDADGDRRHRPSGGPRDVVGRVAVSSYAKLGTGTAATFPENHRHIDYVWVDRSGYDDGRIRFAGQSTIGHLYSDHNSLLARLTLS